MVTERRGYVKIGDNKGRRGADPDENGEVLESYVVHYGSWLKVRDGDFVEIGDELTEGTLNPHDILRTKDESRSNLSAEVQKVYRLQE